MRARTTRFRFLPIRGSRHKTILTRPRNDGDSVKVESYAIPTDPNEVNDLGETETAAADVELLLDWAKNSRLNAPTDSRVLTEDERELLDALGYGGDSDE